ncbi:MAG: hypothetical protein SCARUB_01313 [Candidatus Scalindua rubra]|uniref:DUF3108 domain-containing protein n=1 Tax=Candidatus Scalindua rubra TaxID=1872076 RepID=A0A1E3XDA4_9BACT|nr:MAG: hypothetical protein SCARUB_01313 [Candidatus Scalindua rubra]
MFSFHVGNLYSETHEKEMDLVSTPAFPLGSKQYSKNDITKFDGELLKYKIGFWIFKTVGIATFKCERDGDSLVVTIDACTTGFIDKIIHRHDIYRTTMKIEDSTNRLIPVSSYQKKDKRKKERIMITNYDYENNVCNYKTWRNGVIHKEGSIKLEPDASDDMTSVSYNFRNEIYGEVKEGASFNITTVYKDKFPNFSVNVRSADNSDELSKWKDFFPDIKYVVDVALDPEVLDSKEGKLVILFTEDLIPVGYVAKDVIGFGDLYGFLVEEIN